MGKSQSKRVQSSDVGENKRRSKDVEKTSEDDVDGRMLPAVEETFVQKVAYKCGVSAEELNDKKEVYLQHQEEDPSLGFEEFKTLYTDIGARADDPEFMNEYVEAIFRCGINPFMWCQV